MRGEPWPPNFPTQNVGSGPPFSHGEMVGPWPSDFLDKKAPQIASNSTGSASEANTCRKDRTGPLSHGGERVGPWPLNSRDKLCSQNACNSIGTPSEAPSSNQNDSTSPEGRTPSPKGSARQFTSNSTGSPSAAHAVHNVRPQSPFHGGERVGPWPPNFLIKNGPQSALNSMGTPSEAPSTPRNIRNARPIPLFHHGERVGPWPFDFCNQNGPQNVCNSIGTPNESPSSSRNGSPWPAGRATPDQSRTPDLQAQRSPSNGRVTHTKIFQPCPYGPALGYTSRRRLLTRSPTGGCGLTPGDTGTRRSITPSTTERARAIDLPPSIPQGSVAERTYIDSESLE